MKDIIEAIDLSIKLLNETFQNLKDKKFLEFKLWRIASELEYAALALSLLNDLIDFNPNINNDFQVKSIEEALIKAQNLLKEALTFINENPKATYEKIKQTIKLIKKTKMLV